MTKSQKQLLTLLKFAINSEWIDSEIIPDADGKELFELALRQNLYSYLYPIIITHKKKIGIDEHTIQRWRTATVRAAATQLHNNQELFDIFNIFRSSNISVISLKGLVLKQLYPQPEIRNMSDIDLLVKEEDIEKCIRLLKAHGYFPHDDDLKNPKYMHVEMIKSGSYSVELHRTLWHYTIMKRMDSKKWLSHIWEHQRPVEIGNLHFNALSLEDEFINLVIHFARHIMTSGANLRNLCDICLFIKKYWIVLDITYIGQMLNSMDLYIFYQHLLNTLHLYLGLENLTGKEKAEINNSEILFDIIFNSEINQQRKRKNKTFGKINTFLKRIPFIPKLVRILYFFNQKTRRLRSVGLYLR